jgi:hypothetical protein
MRDERRSRGSVKRKSTTSINRKSISTSISYNRNRLLENRGIGSANLEKFDEQLDSFEAAQHVDRAATDPPFNTEFWSKTREVLELCGDGIGFAQAEEPGMCEIHSTSELFETGNRSSQFKCLLPIQPKVLSERFEIPLNIVLTELMYATSFGMLEMLWSAQCQRCGAGVSSERRMSGLKNDGVCQVCRGENHVGMLDQVGVVFTFMDEILYFPVLVSTSCAKSREIEEKPMLFY